jgi:hypothetical protein
MFGQLLKLYLSPDWRVCHVFLPSDSHCSRSEDAIIGNLAKALTAKSENNLKAFQA